MNGVISLINTICFGINFILRFIPDKISLYTKDKLKFKFIKKIKNTENKEKKSAFNILKSKKYSIFGFYCNYEGEKFVKFPDGINFLVESEIYNIDTETRLVAKIDREWKDFLERKGDKI